MSDFCSLDQCLLWAIFFKITLIVQMLGLLLSQTKGCRYYIDFTTMVRSRDWVSTPPPLRPQNQASGHPGAIYIHIVSRKNQVEVSSMQTKTPNRRNAYVSSHFTQTDVDDSLSGPNGPKANYTILC
jgi:hypothetical protein